MPILQPAAFGQLNSMLGLVGGNTSVLMNQRTPGVSNVRGTMGALGRGPQIALPGGQLFDPTGGTFGQSLEQMTPAATLPLIQAEPERKMGLAETQAGVGSAQTQEAGMKLSFQQQLQQELAKLLMGFGTGPLQAGGAAGVYGLLSHILGI